MRKRFMFSLFASVVAGAGYLSSRTAEGACTDVIFDSNQPTCVVVCNQDKGTDRAFGIGLTFTVSVSNSDTFTLVVVPDTLGSSNVEALSVTPSSSEVNSTSAVDTVCSGRLNATGLGSNGTMKVRAYTDPDFSACIDSRSITVKRSGQTCP